MQYSLIFMLVVNEIRQDLEKVKEGLKKRGWGTEQLQALETIISTDDQRKLTQTELDECLNKINILSKEVGVLYKSGKASEANELKDQVAAIKVRSAELEQEQRRIQDSLETLLLSVPNIPHHSVPAGQSDKDNEIAQDWNGPMPHLPEDARPHWELATLYNIIDFELGTKIAGPGFPLYRGQGARLQRALISFFLDEAVSAGYEEIIPPHLVNENSARATGQLPDK